MVRGRMREMLVSSVLCLLTALPGPAAACSTFLFKGKSTRVFGKSYDFHAG